MAERLPLLALTLQRPWAHMIAYGTKRVENREWEPPAHVIGGYIAIHSGMVYDAEGAKHIAQHAEELKSGPPPKDEQDPKGVIVAVARVRGALELECDGDSPPFPKQTIGPLTPGEVELVLASPWTCGPVAWFLDNVTAFVQPIPCRGMRKLWRVPDEIAAVVRARYAEAKGIRRAG